MTWPCKRLHNSLKKNKTPDCSALGLYYQITVCFYYNLKKLFCKFIWKSLLKEKKAVKKLKIEAKRKAKKEKIKK